MKKIILVIVVLMSVFTTSLFAQKGKLGHINSSDLLALMPERAEAEKQLQNYSKELEEQLNLMNQEFQTKYNDYIAKQDSMSTAIRQMKEEELQSLQQRIQTFQATAQQDLQTKQEELLQPIIDKAKIAIKEVAKELGYTWVFDTSLGSLVVWPDNNDNLLEPVKKKLGIQ